MPGRGVNHTAVSYITMPLAFGSPTRPLVALSVGRA